MFQYTKFAFSKLKGKIRGYLCTILVPWFEQLLKVSTYSMFREVFYGFQEKLMFENNLPNFCIILLHVIIQLKTLSIFFKLRLLFFFKGFFLKVNFWRQRD